MFCLDVGDEKTPDGVVRGFLRGRGEGIIFSFQAW